jgi:hypothetical protein
VDGVDGGGGGGGGEALGGVGFARGGGVGEPGDVWPAFPDDDVATDGASPTTAAFDAARRRVTCAMCFDRWRVAECAWERGRTTNTFTT